MPSRMTRYEDESIKNMSRSNRNQKLYDSFNDNTSFTTYTDVKNTNAVLLDAASKNYRTREGYQKIKEYDFVPKPKVKKEEENKENNEYEWKELDDFNNLYSSRENKVYDINSVIEQAKKNRIKNDIEEEKRKLKNTNYNILASLDPEKIEEYRAERNKVVRASDEEIRELINTITTKTLNGEIDQETSVNLLSDLMATQAVDMVEGVHEEERIEKNDTDILKQEELKLVKEKEEEEEKKASELKENNQSSDLFRNMDKSFYTKSMDLSDKDFDIDLDSDVVKHRKTKLAVKIILTIILLLLVAALVYFLVKGI